jgi:hypothetical protein
MSLPSRAESRLCMTQLQIGEAGRDYFCAVCKLALLPPILTAQTIGLTDGREFGEYAGR